LILTVTGLLSMAIAMIVPPAWVGAPGWLMRASESCADLWKRNGQAETGRALIATVGTGISLGAPT
jgi:hypothetical protein